MFTKAFWVSTFEAVLASAAAAFAGSLVLTTTPTLKNFIAGLVAGGLAGLYTFTKALGASQTAKAAKAAR